MPELDLLHQAATNAVFSFFYLTTLSAIANSEQSGGGWALYLLLGPRAKPPTLDETRTGDGCGVEG